HRRLGGILYINLPAPDTQPGISIIHHSELARSNALQLFFRNNAVTLRLLLQPAFDKLRRMAYLESHLHLFLRSLPGIIRNEMKIVHTEFIAVLQCRITSAGHVNHILLHILADNKPRSSTQPQSFTLADGMKPIAPMLAQLSTRFQLHNIPFPFAKETAHKIIIINLSQKADALTVTTSGAGQS